MVWGTCCDSLFPEPVYSTFAKNLARQGATVQSKAAVMGTRPQRSGLIQPKVLRGPARPTQSDPINAVGGPNRVGALNFFQRVPARLGYGAPLITPFHLVLELRPADRPPDARVGRARWGQATWGDGLVPRGSGAGISYRHVWP